MKIEHIALYVNEFTVDIGDDGLAAVEALTACAGSAVSAPG